MKTKGLYHIFLSKYNYNIVKKNYFSFTRLLVKLTSGLDLVVTVTKTFPTFLADTSVVSILQSLGYRVHKVECHQTAQRSSPRPFRLRIKNCN